MKIAMLFPGYGSQFVGMGKELYDEHRIVQECFEEASNCLNINFVKLCFASSDHELSKIENAYPALFLLSYSIGTLLIEHGVNPLVVAGMGVGEYSALASVKGLTLPDGLYFLMKQALIYQDFLAQHQVVLLEIEDTAYWKEIRALLKEHNLHKDVHISTILPKTVVLACKAEVLNACKTLLAEHSFKVQEVPLGLGLHTPFAGPVLDAIKDYVLKIDFKDAIVPLITAADGLLKKDGQEIKDALLSSIDTPIRWDIVCNKLEHMDLIIEVGPGTVFSKQLAGIYPNKHIISVNKPADLALVLKHLDSQNSEDKEST